MTVTAERSDGPFGARVTGVDLSRALSAADIQRIRELWLEHKVLAFPGQAMDDDDLERFTIAMGGFGEDPFFDPIEGRKNIAAILREADETSPLFAENWHSDWSFLEYPPAGTCLLAVDIPSTGGDTLFADQQAAFEALSEDRKDFLRGLTAIHSAQLAYAPEGTYGERDQGRSMAIRPNETREKPGRILWSRNTRKRVRSASIQRLDILSASREWSRQKRLPCWPNLPSGSRATNSSIATSGNPTCSSCGTIAPCCTRHPGATRDSGANCTARPLRRGRPRLFQP